MSKYVRPAISIEERVRSARHAREMALQAERERDRIKGDIFSLVTATPKDITPRDEDPRMYLKEIFDNLWEELWDAFVDDYKYTAVADDVEYSDDSLVRKEWDEEEKERQALCGKREKRNKFFEEYGHVFRKDNFDDIQIYNMYDNGEITLPSPSEITPLDRDRIMIGIRKDQPF